MINHLRSLVKPQRSLRENVEYMMNHFHQGLLFEHTLEVLERGLSLCDSMGTSEEEVTQMALCHDLGRLIPLDEMVSFVESRGYDVSDDEARVPGVLHQKASAGIARDVLGIKNPKVLKAIMVHTTLIDHASDHAILLFLADKLSWHDEGHQELVLSMELALTQSVEMAISAFFSILHEERHDLAIYHPWSERAYRYYCL